MKLFFLMTLILLPALAWGNQPITVDDIKEGQDWKDVYLTIPSLTDWGKKQREVRFPEAKFSIQIDERSDLQDDVKNFDKAIFRISWSRVKGSGEASGPCGDSSEKKLNKQKEMLAKAKTDADADKAFSVTRHGMAGVMLYKIKNLKVATGFEDCQPEVEGYDGSNKLDWINIDSIFYQNGYLVLVELNYIPNTENVTISNSSDFFSDIIAGKKNGKTTEHWNMFVKTLQTIKLMK